MFKCFREVSAAITDFFNKFVKKDFSATHSNLISLIKFLLILYVFLNFSILRVTVILLIQPL